MKKEEGKIQIGKVSKTKIQISHIHTVPKSTSESQAHITHLLTAPEPARGENAKCQRVLVLTLCLVAVC